VRSTTSILLLLLCAVLSLGQTSELSAQSTKVNPNSFRITGSGTLYPLTKIVAHMYAIRNKRSDITVDHTGTGAGFDEFTNGNSVINNASRPITSSELEQLKSHAIDVLEIPVAVDGISIVVNKSNIFLDSLSTKQLADIFRANSPYEYWSDLRQDWPHVPIQRVGPGTMHGTYDYFHKNILGDQSINEEYHGFEEYSDIAAFIAQNKFAIGYMGFAQLINHQRALKPLAIDNGAGAISPNFKTISKGSYQPLTRTLYLYVDRSALERPEVKSFIDYYLSHAADFCAQAGFIPLPKKRYQQITENINLSVNQNSASLLK
jgi:phosphate transport system substrate-binding protein